MASQVFTNLMFSADGLAELLVQKLLAELPPRVNSLQGARAAVMLNGLGTVKYEELFVVYRKVDQLLRAAGIEIVAPDVGELVTSFDMAGVSLTLFWLTPELEATWIAPADTPAYRKGNVQLECGDEVSAQGLHLKQSLQPGSPDSQAAASVILEALEAMKQTIDDNSDELGRLDAITGDGDHGIGTQRGVTAAVAAAAEALNAG